MTAAVAEFPVQEMRLGTPPSRRCPTPPSTAIGRPESGLIFGGRRVATPMGLAALWEPRKEPQAVSHSVPAPPGGSSRFSVQGTQWVRASGSPQKSGPLLIRAEAPAATPTVPPTTHSTQTPRTRFDSPSPHPRPVSTSRPRPSVTPSRMGFPEPCQSPARASSPVVHRAASPAPQPVRREVSQLAPQAARRKEDLIHQHVLYVLRKNPDVARLRRVQQVTEGVYLIDGQEVNIEWRHSPEPGQRGYPIVVDGPMRQPLIDYLRANEENKEFDLDTVKCTTALHQVPKDKRMTFDDKHKQYSRLEAMKVAKEQASIREQAADYTLDGKQVPDALVQKYNQALRTKVRGSRSKEDRVILAQEKQDLAPLHAAQAKVEAPVKTEKIELVPQVAHCAPLRQPSPSPAAMRMAAQAIAVVSTDLRPSIQPSESVAALTPFPHRPLSLNGVPSFVPVGSWQPPLRVTRSWSGACLDPELPGGAWLPTVPTASVPVASIQLTPVAQVVTPGHVVMAQRQISVGHFHPGPVPSETAPQRVAESGSASTPAAPAMTPGTPTSQFSK